MSAGRDTERRPSGPPAVLEMRGVTKTFGPVVANDHISLVLHRGEVLGLLGENGAGKSTLMKILYGLYSPDEGEIFVDGERVEIRTPADAVRLGIGMVHQHFTLIPRLTVAENIVLGSEPRGRGGTLDMSGAIRATEELSRRYGLRVDPRARVADLSVGLQQRVEILKALYREARILVLDEPTAVLTPQETRDLFGVLKELVADGLSIIFITHKLEELFGVSDNITVIRDGRVVNTVRTSDSDARQLARLMVGRDVVLQVEKKPEVKGEALRLEVRGLVVESEFGVGVRGVDLAVRAGEILGIAGVDGNGQTELAEALAGMRPVDSGGVYLDGEEVTHLGARERHERGLAYIPEDRREKGLVQEFTLAENYALKSYAKAPFSRWGWLFPGRMRREAEKQLRAFDVRPLDPDAPARTLSGGNQQKVILARELSGEPGVIIASQPTRGLDVGAIEFVHEMLLKQREAGKAVLLISMELEEVRSLSDRIAVIYDGGIVGELEAGEATDEQLGLLMAGHSPEEAGLR
ncbi:ABC transporter ATP-binding protein [Rubrobacter calidifluminis]|uniref:ABC transporter ATP-binding protein n=1 Tax=Rubrobacter calidifluminis TaxID=1392640 RepID=UPI0023602349|nr:ABC transporter ATP-binding protein [Rubrobacter calidifluminis]